MGRSPDFLNTTVMAFAEERACSRSSGKLRQQRSEIFRYVRD